jgi:hypothetical protein
LQDDRAGDLSGLLEYGLTNFAAAGNGEEVNSEEPKEGV